ncbi:endopolyphosphatase [Kluyveromyces marxianus]|uniref:Endopolyphosphatase n=1 Tax=Kluyveromyces marxianus TaxID=4911 RepID=A0ABX6EVT2_KLUMA|nr:endopolyphosphatase [Kluyveromyces marxianus]BAP72081.1 endopolyphosphatase [Kluyveromyces marxianus]
MHGSISMDEPRLREKEEKPDRLEVGGKPQGPQEREGSYFRVWKQVIHVVLLLGTIVTYFYFFRRENLTRPLEELNGEVHGFTTSLSDDRNVSSADILSMLNLSPNQPVKITDLSGKRARHLKGRFLHITDMHPDLYYKEGSSTRKTCHRGKPQDDKDRAARFGNAMMGCDAPPALMDYTLKWIEDNLKDEIDFIIWTGDNVRHDNDRMIPRTEQQIFDMNRHVSELFSKKFRDPSSQDPREFTVKIIPSLGNNDVFPHNMFSTGPTLQTRELFDIWRNFIPQEQQNTFDRYTSFFVEVIPGQLAVISLNTLYLFKGNPLVDNCSSKNQPGYKLLLWLGYTLQELRSRGMKVWLSGHVPPIAKNADSSCSDKLALWLHEYNDIIIGGVYGHMNMDHFIPIDGKKAWDNLAEDYSALEFEARDFVEDASAGRRITIEGAKPVKKVSYMNRVRDQYYSKVAAKYDRVSRKDPLFERYSLVHVGTSIIPTFNPGFRVWEYNITALQTQEVHVHSYQPWDTFFEELEEKIESESLRPTLEEEEEREHEQEEDENDDDISIAKKKKKGRKGKKGKKGKKRRKDWWKDDKTIPRKKPKDIEPGPSYENQLFSPLRFVQYYADLKQIDKDYRKLVAEGKSEDEAASIAFQYQVEYTSDQKPYPMKTLLVKDYMKLASMLAVDDKVWDKYLERAFCSSGYEE